MILQARQDVGEPGLRVDVVELCGLDQRVDSGGPPAAFVRAGEGPVVASDGNAAQRPLGGIVRHAQAAVIEEARERDPAIEAVVDRLGDIVARGEVAALLAQPGLQRGDRRPAALVVIVGGILLSPICSLLAIMTLARMVMPENGDAGEERPGSGRGGAGGGSDRALTLKQPRIGLSRRAPAVSLL